MSNMVSSFPFQFAEINPGFRVTIHFIKSHAILYSVVNNASNAQNEEEQSQANG